ncbi:MAG: ROK family protein, partial [Anaerolineales bacterium]|nr:ROK family protein [Anaerolineales bacterium]
EHVGDAARKSDPLAMEVIQEAASYLGRALADFAHIFNPEIFVLGGGVSQLGPLLFEPVEAELRDSIMSPTYLEGLRIEPAALGDDAGLVGAMVLASDQD